MATENTKSGNLTRDEMILREPVDLVALKTIRDNFDYLYDSGLLGRFVDPHQKRKYITDKNTILTIINDFYAQKVKSPIVKYKYSSGITWGRMFSIGVSLQGMSRVIRHTVGKDLFVDLDIVNAHPQILMKYCVDEKIDAPFLKKYIETRDDCLAQLMACVDGDGKTLTRDEAKAFPLAVINGGDRVCKFQDGQCPDWLVGLGTDVRTIYNQFIKSKKGQRMMKRAIDKESQKDFFNLEGSTLNYLLCEQENLILTRIYRYLQDKNVRVATFCFDGCLIYADDWKGDVMVPRIKEIINEELGYNLEFKVKSLDEAIDLKQFNLKPTADVDGTDEAMAQFVLATIGEDLLYYPLTKEFYLYDVITALWKKYDDFEILKTLFSKILIPYLTNIKDEKERSSAISNIKSSGKQTAVLASIKSVIKMMDHSNIIDKLDKNGGIFPITDNKVIDLKTLTVRSRTREDYLTRTTERVFKPEGEYDVQFVRKYIEEILGTNNAVYVDWLLFVMGYCLTGENNMKQFYVLLGEKDTGKSLFCKLMCQILERFGGVVNDKVFKASNTASVHDAEAFSLCEKRLAFVSELGEKERFNEQLMKKISGGDAVNIRGCGGKVNNEVLFNCVLLLATNEIPQFTETAFAGRMRIITFPTRFFNNPERRDAILSKTDDFFSAMCVMAHKYYINKLNFEDVPEVLDSTKTVIDDKDTFKSWTDDQEDYIIDKSSLGGKAEPTEPRCKKTAVYGSYSNWCISNHLCPIGRNTFYKQMEQVYNLPEYNQGKMWRGMAVNK